MSEDLRVESGRVRRRRPSQVEEYYISFLLYCKCLICLFYKVELLPIQRKLCRNFLEISLLIILTFISYLYE